MYVNQTELGKLFGGTSHDVGRWLDEIGLRSEGRPTRRALQGGYVSTASLQCGGFYYKWDREKTILALEQAGHKRVPQKSSARITGPFSMVENGLNAFQILSGDGTVAIWVIGQENADIVVRLLNLWHKYGPSGESK